MDELTNEADRRWEMVDGLRAAADLLANPFVPLPVDIRIGVHTTDPSEFTARCNALDLTIAEGREYDTARMDLGGEVYYQLQARSRLKERLAELEKAIAERERELGLTAEDIAA